MRFALLCLSSLMALGVCKKFDFDVRGRVLCNKARREVVRIQLWEHDWFSPDDLLYTAFLNKNGSFVLEGSEDELFWASPYIWIEHTCGADDGCLVFTRVDHLPAPSASGTYEVGDIDLTLQDDSSVLCDSVLWHRPAVASRITLDA